MYKHKTRNLKNVFKSIFVCLLACMMFATSVFAGETGTNLQGTGLQNHELDSYDIALIDNGCTTADYEIVMVDAPYEDHPMSYSHGEELLNVIREQNPDATVLSIKVIDGFGQGTAEDVAQAIRLAIEKNVRIINLSMIALDTEMTEDVKTAVQEAMEQGIQVVAAAGNMDDDVMKYIPANMDEVITVSSCDETGTENPDTNFGEAVDYSVVSENTSEAAAKMSGWLSLHSAEEAGSAPFVFQPTKTEISQSTIEYTMEDGIFYLAYDAWGVTYTKLKGSSVKTWEGIAATYGQHQLVHSTQATKIEYSKNTGWKSGYMKQGSTRYPCHYLTYKKSNQDSALNGNWFEWTQGNYILKVEFVASGGDHLDASATYAVAVKDKVANGTSFGIEFSAIVFNKQTGGTQISTTLMDDATFKTKYSQKKWTEIPQFRVRIKLSVRSANTNNDVTSKLNRVYCRVGGIDTGTGVNDGKITADGVSNGNFLRSADNLLSNNIGYNTSNHYVFATDGGNASSGSDAHSVFMRADTQSKSIELRFSTSTTDWLFLGMYSQTATVTYNSKGGSACTAATVDCGYSVTLPSPTKAGHSFGGWYTEEALTTSAGAGGASYTPTKNITLFAKWNENTAKLKYNMEGGSGGPSEQIMYYTRQANVSTTAPTRSGYSFMGWATSDARAKAGTVDYAAGAVYKSANKDPVEATLYAVWRSTLSYNANGGSGAPGAQYMYCTGATTVSTTKPTKTGNTFAGWNTAANGSGTSYASGATLKAANTWRADTILYAQWTPNVYTITLNNQSATSAGTTVYYEQYGKGNFSDSACKNAISSITKPTRTGYTFGGYYTSTGGSGTQCINASGTITAGNTAFTANTTLYAKWTPTNGTIYYNAGRASGTAVGAPLNNAHCNGLNSYKFGTLNGTLISSTYNITTTAYNAWDTDSLFSPPVGYRHNVPAQQWRLYNKTKQKWVGGGKGYSSASINFTTLTADITWGDEIHFYANWAPIYTITLDHNGGSSSRNAIYEAYEIGYFLDAAATSNQMTTNANAVAKPSKTCTVTYNANGGSCTTGSASKTATFNGYYTAASDGTQYINANGNLTSSASNTFFTSNGSLYAHWTGGTTTLPTPSRTGYEFNGWFTAASGGTTQGKGGATYTINANTTLYAQWSPKWYTVTLNNQGATTAGTTSIQEKYATGYYLTTSSTTAMSASAQGITKPVKAYTVSFNTHGGNAVAAKTASYTFNGYYTATSGGVQYIGSNGFLTNQASNTQFYNDAASNNNLYAQWTATSVTLPVPTRPGYSFDGWYTAETGGEKITTSTYTPTANTTLHARWNAETYEITLDPDCVMTTGADSLCNTDAYTKKIYEVFGTRYALTPTGAAMTASANKVIVPVRKYNVTYSLQGGYMPSGTPSYDVAEYTFGGYYTSKNGAGAQYIGTNGALTNSADNTHYTVNGTMYAKWTNGGLTPTTPKRLGYAFTGWNTKSDGSGTNYPSGTPYYPTDNSTIYAQWTPAIYNVVFHSNFPTDTTSTQQIQRDFSIPLNDNPFTRDGYLFVGWATSPDGNVAYTNKTAVTNLAEHGQNINLYAIWQDATEILFVDQGTGNAPEISMTDDNQGKFKIVEVKSSPGYIMDGSVANVDNLDTTENPGTFDLSMDGAAASSQDIVIDGVENLMNIPFVNEPNAYTITKVDQNGDPIFGIDGYGNFDTAYAATFEFWVEPLAGAVAIGNSDVICTYTKENVTRNINTGVVETSTVSELQGLTNHGTLQTDSTGKISLSRLRPGKWHFVETNAPTGYTMVSAEYTFTVDENGYIGNSKEGSREIMNPAETANPDEVALYITKQDTASNLLDGIVFEVRKGSETATPTLYTTGDSIPGQIVLYNELNEPEVTSTTTFYIKEAAEQPNLPEGVINSDTTEYIVTVTVDGASRSISVNGGTPTQYAEIAFTNETNKFRIQKKTESGDPLENAEFKIWKSDNSESYENLRTDANGFTRYLTKLSSGTWYYQETFAPGGYLLDKTIYQFTVDATTHEITLDGEVEP